MRFSPDILDEIRARLPVSQVVARKVALKKRGREFVGLSPFKTEKTPSFTVNDAKGFYHCFASGEHGDIFTFVMKTEGLSFPEAVERLSAEAGVALPKPPPQDQAQSDQRQRLYEVLQCAQEYFVAALHDYRNGSEARSYLEHRGLSEQTLEDFGIGYAPNSREGLKAHLSSKGFSAQEAAQSGMIISGEDIVTPYDRFRHRVMFPIRDAKQRVIAFGGRALASDQAAKYLNSPETQLFHKGRVLFNAATARKAAFETSRLIVVEGYMDVVSLAQAGFSESVAPLGTALTFEQIALIWRMVDEPLLCFDGDAAGLKAAYRAIDTALPHLKPGKSLRFVFLPNGLDPDDVVRQGGAEDLEKLLTKARPLAEVLFQREFKVGKWDTPERRAGLEQRLNALASQIEDRGVRSHYERDVRSRLFEAWSNHRVSPPHRPPALRKSGEFRQNVGQDRRHSDRRDGPGQPGWNKSGGQLPKPTSGSLGESKIVRGLRSSLSPREGLIIRTLINHPWLIDEHAEAIASLRLASGVANMLRKGILSAHAVENSLDTARLRFHLEQANLGELLDLVEGAITHQSDRFAEPDAEIDDVEKGWSDLISLQELSDIAHLR